jgi:serine O-acetyltransferase
MVARVISLFGTDPRDCGNGLFRLIVSDYLAYYREKERARGRPESPQRRALLFLPRVLHNPCLHATILLRLALASPRFTLGLWRTLLIAKHSIDIQPDIEIGPGLKLLHPFGIALGWGLRVGSNVAILHNVSIGAAHRQPEGVYRASPIIEDDVTIYTQSFLSGPITVGRGALIGAGSFVDYDVAPGAVVRGGFQRRSERDETLGRESVTNTGTASGQ